MCREIQTLLAPSIYSVMTFCGAFEVQTKNVAVCANMNVWYLTHSRGEAGGWHPPWHGDPVCAGEERSEDVPTDPLQPLPQDQRQTGRHQQHPGSTPTVKTTKQIKVNKELLRSVCCADRWRYDRRVYLRRYILLIFLSWHTLLSLCLAVRDTVWHLDRLVRR